jgi:hypothetical protein
LKSFYEDQRPELRADLATKKLVWERPVLPSTGEQKDNRRDLPCETGVIDLKGFLGALVKIGYAGAMRAEPLKADLRRLSAEEAVDRTAKAMKRAMEHIHYGFGRSSSDQFSDDPVATQFSTVSPGTATKSASVVTTTH